MEFNSSSLIHGHSFFIKWMHFISSEEEHFFIGIRRTNAQNFGLLGDYILFFRTIFSEIMGNQHGENAIKCKDVKLVCIDRKCEHSVNQNPQACKHV